MAVWGAADRFHVMELRFPPAPSNSTHRPKLPASRGTHRNSHRIGPNPSFARSMRTAKIIDVMRRVCPNSKCGADNISTKANYCPKCGTALNTEESPKETSEGVNDWFALLPFGVVVVFFMMLRSC